MPKAKGWRRSKSKKGDANPKRRGTEQMNQDADPYLTTDIQIDMKGEPGLLNNRKTNNARNGKTNNARNDARNGKTNDAQNNAHNGKTNDSQNYARDGKTNDSQNISAKYDCQNDYQNKSAKNDSHTDHNKDTSTPGCQ